MCTLKLAPAARVVGPQDNVWGGGGTAVAPTEHSPALDCVSIDQVTPEPEPAGNGSLTVTPLAVPVPAFLTVTVKPIGSPAFTGDASAVLVIWMLAGLQMMTASLEPDPSLVVVTLAVLS